MKNFIAMKMSKLNTRNLQFRYNIWIKYIFKLFIKFLKVIGPEELAAELREDDPESLDPVQQALLRKNNIYLTYFLYFPNRYSFVFYVI